MPGSLRVGSQRTSKMSPNDSAVSSRSDAALVPSNDLAIVSSTRLTPAAWREGLSISTMLRMLPRIASLSTRSSRKEGMVDSCALRRADFQLREDRASIAPLSCPSSIESFDYLVGAGEHRGRQVEAEGLGGLK